MSSPRPQDRRWLDSAARLATQFLGTSGVGPTVGALIVDEQRQLVFGRAVTPAGGHTRAELIALGEVKSLAVGRTLYATLEPAAHFSALKPATDAIIAARIGRVVVGGLDPDRKHAGKGLARLEAAGIEVVHLDHEPSRLLNEGYACRIARARPFVTLKLALSADGMVGYRAPGAPWLGDDARRWIEMQRATSDAVLAGAARATIENLDLAVRWPGLHARRHLRLVVVGEGALDPEIEIFSAVSGYPTAVVALPGRELGLRATIEQIAIEGKKGRPSLHKTMAMLAGRGVNRLFVEAGARLAEALIAGELVDRLHIIMSDKKLGRVGIPAAVLGTFEDRITAARFYEVDQRLLGEDKVRTLERR